MLSFFSQSASFSEPIRWTVSFPEMDSNYNFLIKVTVQDGAIHMFRHFYICMIIFISFICNLELVAWLKETLNNDGRRPLAEVFCTIKQTSCTSVYSLKSLRHPLVYLLSAGSKWNTSQWSKLIIKSHSCSLVLKTSFVQ